MNSKRHVVERLLRDSEMLNFFLQQVRSGKLEVITTVYGGCHTTLSYQKLIETLVEGEDWEHGYLYGS